MYLNGYKDARRDQLPVVSMDRKIRVFEFVPLGDDWLGAGCNVQVAAGEGELWYGKISVVFRFEDQENVLLLLRFYENISKEFPEVTGVELIEEGRLEALSWPA